MNQWKVFILGAAVILCTSGVGFAVEQVTVKTVRAEQTAGEKTKAGTNSMMERLSDGALNIVYGPLEVPYRLKEDIKRYDPLRGIIPGILKGAGWFVAREVVGVFEILTFYLPNQQPILPPFDTDWIYA